MSDQHLDKLFIDKLGKRDFSYKESYWNDFLKQSAKASSASKGGSMGSLFKSAKLSLITPLIILAGLTYFSWPIINYEKSILYQERDNSSLHEALGTSKNENHTEKYTGHDSLASIGKNTLIEKNKSVLDSTLKDARRYEAQQYGFSDSMATLNASKKDVHHSGSVSIDPSSLNSEQITQTRKTEFANNGAENSKLKSSNSSTEEMAIDLELDDSEFVENSQIDAPSSSTRDEDATAVMAELQVSETLNLTIDQTDNPSLLNELEQGIGAGRDKVHSGSKESFSNQNQKTGLILHSQSTWNVLKTREQLIIPDRPFAVYAPKNFELRYSVSGQIGNAWISKNLKAIDMEYQAVNDYRISNELNRSSLTGGINFQVHHKAYSLSTGIHFMNWGERTAYQSSPETYEIFDTVIVEYYDTSYFEVFDTSYWEIIIVDSMFIDSILVTETDSVWVTTTDSLFNEQRDTLNYNPGNTIGRENGYTAIRYFEIPIIFGYEKQFNNWLVGCSGGISIGFLTATRGYYVNQAIDDLIPINTNYAIFRKTLFNLQLGAHIGYRFTEHLDGILGLRYRQNLTSILSDGFMDQRYKAYVLSLAVRYNF
jgi:hypothetical protein